MDKVAKTRGLEPEDLKGYGDFMKSKLIKLSDAEKANWTSRQVYLAFGNFLSAAAALKIDTCPMEGFETEQYNQILGLSDKGLTAAVIATVGYRSQEDKTQTYAKVRKSKSELFTHI
jgi:nitroreductase